MTGEQAGAEGEIRGRGGREGHYGRRSERAGIGVRGGRDRRAWQGPSGRRPSLALGSFSWSLVWCFHFT